MVLSAGIGQILDKLAKNNIEAFLVGGAVRDSLLGRIPNDYDIASNADPERIKALFDRVILVGERYRTVTVIENGEQAEITQYRSEGEYTDGRHPDTVTYAATIEEDLVRRDFTVNAMAYNKDRGLIDPCGGRADLRRRVIRAVGDPNKRFSEDALRIIRAYRFASVLDFDVDNQTDEAAKQLCGTLCSVSCERIRHELSLLLTGFRPSLACELVKNGGLSEFFGADCMNKYDIIDRSSCDLEVRFTMLCIICKAEDFASVARALRYPKRFCKAVGDVEKLLYKNLSNKAEIKRTMGRFSPETVKKALTVRRELLHEDTTRSIELINRIQRNGEPYKISQLALSGDELIKLGFKGSGIGDELVRLLEFVIDSPGDNNKTELINQAKKHR